MDKRWLNEKEACIYTTFCRETLRDARDNGMAYRRNGRRIIYEKSELDRYMERLEKHENGRIKTYK